MLGLSGGGAGRADELRRTRLYREASNMYYTQASFFLGIALAAALFATPTAAIEFVGKVVGVTDGDTLGSVSIALAAVLAVGHAEPVSAKGLNRQQVRALNGLDGPTAATSRAALRHRRAREAASVRASIEVAPLGSGIRQDGLGRFPQAGPVPAQSDPIALGLALQEVRGRAIR
jgi:hypothetical protein